MVKYWILAMRPKTLPAALSPVIIGCAFAFHMGVFHFAPAALCVGFALLIQILVNYANDYYDGIKGTDSKGRRGPARMVGAGLISPKAMHTGTWTVCILAFLVGINLVPYAGWWLIILGLICLATAFLYTAGPYPLGYHGWGDLFVFIFFGLVSVNMTFFVQGQHFNGDLFLLGAGAGLMCLNLFIVTSYRDIENDSRVGKKTLAVRFGRNFARTEYALSYLTANIIPTYLFLLKGYPRALLLTWITLPLNVKVFKQLLLDDDSNVDYNSFIGKTGASLLLYAATVSLALVL